jgi:peroxiredoxin
MLTNTINSTNKIGKLIEIATNVSIILVALIGATVLVKNYLLRSPAPAFKQIETSNLPGPPNAGQRAGNTATAKPGPAEGTQVSLQGVSWGQSNKSVVLALSDQCHFCTESAPFYQKLTTELAQRRDVQVIAVFPQQVGDGKQYLGKLGVPISDVRQAAFDSLGVRGTPTLMIVDRNGKVEQSWVGRLSPDKESEVLARLKA